MSEEAQPAQELQTVSLQILGIIEKVIQKKWAFVYDFDTLNSQNPDIASKYSLPALITKASSNCYADLSQFQNDVDTFTEYFVQNHSQTEVNVAQYIQNEIAKKIKKLSQPPEKLLQEYRNLLNQPIGSSIHPNNIRPKIPKLYFPA